MDPSGNSGTGVPGAEVSPARAWSSVVILLILLLVSMLDRQVISLLVDPIKADLDLSDTQIGLLQGLAFTLFYSVAAIPIGWAVDRFPRRLVCYAGVTVWSLGAAACGLAGNFWQLFAARITVGAGEASLNPSAVSLISDLFPREKVGSAMGVYGSAVSLGSGFALIVGGLVVDLFAGREHIVFPLVGEIRPWQAVFLATGLPGIAIAFLAFLLKDPRPARPAQAKRREKDGFGQFLRTNWKLIALVLSGFSLSSFTFYAVGAWTPAFLGRTFGMAAGEIGWALGLIFALAGASGAVGGGMVIDRVHGAGVDDAPMAVPLYAALVAWPFFGLCYLMPSPALVLAGVGIGTLLVGMIAAGSLSVWQRVSPPQFRGRLAAIFGLVTTGFGATLGPVMPALVTDQVFGDEAMVGWSLSVVLAIALPLLALSLASARRVLAAGPDPSIATDSLT